MSQQIKFETRNNLMDDLQKELKSVDIIFTKEFQESGSIIKQVKRKKNDSDIDSDYNKDKIQPKYTSPLLCFRSYRYLLIFLTFLFSLILMYVFRSKLIKYEFKLFFSFKNHI